MKEITLKYNMLLFLTAFIWGIGFVFQSQGAAYLDPLTFCAIRYFLGAVAVAIVLLAIVIFTKTSIIKLFPPHTIIDGLITGFTLFAASAFQQAGLKYTTIFNAGFITEMGIVFVPVFAMLLGEQLRTNAIVGVVLVIIGLYILTKPPSFHDYNKGDALELLGALLWAVQLLLMDRKAPASNPFALSFAQFLFCSIFSSLAAIIFEPINLNDIESASASLLYTGFMSCGIAFTMQVIAQQKTPAVYTAMILSLEAVFAALAGWLYLNEAMNMMIITGGALMLFGILVAQLHMLRAIPVKYKQK